MKALQTWNWKIVQSLFMGAAVSAQAATFVVTNTLDSGFGSFRQALLDAANTPGVDLITFSNVSGHIKLLSPPPMLEDTIVIGPGARQLTIATPQILIGGGETTISGLRLTPANPWPDWAPGGGGGLLRNFGDLFLHDCEIVSAAAYLPLGAAIYNAGNLTITSSTIASNHVHGVWDYHPDDCCCAAGGGLYVAGGNVFITNSTFSGNFSTECHGTGGAIHVENGNVFLVNCTFTGNYAAQGGALYKAGGFVSLRNSIVTDSISGTIDISENNLITNALSAGVGPLQDNGGPTLTHGLAPNSPAINQGTSEGAPANDQRGVPRPQGGKWDIGSFELEVEPSSFYLGLTVHGPGTVSRYPDRFFHGSNDLVVITAYPEEDYEFAEWAGDADGRKNPLLLTMDADKSIIARFEYAPATVTNLPDAVHYVVNTNGWGPGSFRQAIRNVNASGGGTLLFSNVTGPISLPLGIPAIQASVRISGTGPSNLLLRFPYGTERFAISAGTTAMISGMTIESQQRSTGSGGAISNAGQLVLARMHFVSCSSSNGGAVFNVGSAQISDCLFSNNRASAGGAIHNRGNMQVANSLFQNNRVSALESFHGGGAFYNSSGEAEFVSCSFTGNRAEGSTPWDPYRSVSGASGKGGAVYIAGGQVGMKDVLCSSNLTRGHSGSSGSFGQVSGSGGSAVGSAIYLQDAALMLTNCALINNIGIAGDSPWASREPGSGGAAMGGGIFMHSGELFVVNGTFSGNEVRSGNSGGGGFDGWPGGGVNGFGGAIAFRLGTASLVNCTITANKAYGGTWSGGDGNTIGRGIGGGFSAVWGDEERRISLLNTIVAGNLAAAMGTNGLVADDLVAPASSRGHNLVGTAMHLTNFLASDLIEADPMIGPLQNNGGATPTHALLDNSPAIDAGAPSPVSFDQRGQPRRMDDPAIPNPIGSDGTDIGAMERNHVLSVVQASASGGDVQITFTTVSDKSYRLQYNSDLAATSWTTLPEIFRGTGGLVTATDSEAKFLTYKFYRVFHE